MFALLPLSFAEVGEWIKKADTSTAYYGLATSVVNRRIYAIGGHAGAQFYSTVEEYDPATDTWTRKTDMLTARNGLSTSVVDRKIYAISGLSHDDSFLSTIEVYNPATDTWTTEPNMMPTTRGGLSTTWWMVGSTQSESVQVHGQK